MMNGRQVADRFVGARVVSSAVLANDYALDSP